MADDRKKAIAAMLIARPAAGKEPDGEESESNPDAPHEGHMQAAHDIIEAMKSGDAEELAHALKAFVEMCESDEEY